MMKKFLEILAIATLLTWGIMFLYFYTTGRIDQYLDPSFRIYALLSGIGLLLLGGFNFLNRNRAIGLCTHDHAHGDACDHDHHHEEHYHSHEHSDHGDHDHAHCDHDHAHGEACDHDHHHEEEAEHHHHDHETTTSGLLFSLLVLLIPLLVASAYSQDKFSSEYLMKWGKIERQMMQLRIAKSRGSQSAANKVGSVDPADNPYTRDAINQADPDNATTAPADTPPEPKEETEDSGNDSWATFTLEDLKQMVPQSDAGDFLLDVPQIFYTAGDRELMDVMEGIPVETSAQLMEETLNNPNGHRLKAFRLFIECCAADARPLSIPVDFGKAPPEYTEMGWYKLFGKLHYVTEEEEILPVLKIERIEETTEPIDGLIF